MGLSTSYSFKTRTVANQIIRHAALAAIWSPRSRIAESGHWPTILAHMILSYRIFNAQ